MSTPTLDYLSDSLHRAHLIQGEEARVSELLKLAKLIPDVYNLNSTYNTIAGLFDAVSKIWLSQNNYNTVMAELFLHLFRTLDDGQFSHLQIIQLEGGNFFRLDQEQKSDIIRRTIILAETLPDDQHSRVITRLAALAEIYGCRAQAAELQRIGRALSSRREAGLD